MDKTLRIFLRKISQKSQYFTSLIQEENREYQRFWDNFWRKCFVHKSYTFCHRNSKLKSLKVLFIETPCIYNELILFNIGRDTKSAQALIRKHESYENDLVALEAQLQVINEDAVALQVTLSLYIYLYIYLSIYYLPKYLLTNRGSTSSHQ